MLINNIITYLYIERKPEQHEIFRRNLHILESNLWNAIQSEVFRIAWHSALLDGYLTLDDLKRIQAALDFLLPVFPAEREAQKIFRAAILKTKAMLKRKT